MNNKRLVVALSMFLSMLVTVTQANIAFAQHISSTGPTIYLPIAALSINETSNPQTVDADELMQRLTEKFKNTGINFHKLESAPDGTLYLADVSAAGIDASAISSFNENNLLKIKTEEELTLLLDSIAKYVQESNSATSNYEDGPSVQAAQIINSSATARWYEPLCGTGAYFLGSVFCWKNIFYSYQIDDVQRRIVNPSVTGSSLTGANIALYWTNQGGSANVVNSKTVSLRANGVYLLGVQIMGLNAGLTWSGSWTRTVNPPCAICQ
ncbi:MAG: hypothetical protein R3A44_12620 [Caldilineaceae bacterium]